MTERVQAVERALLMLEEIAASKEPITTANVAHQAGVNRGTAWRLLNTLEHFDLIERDDYFGGYKIGYGAARLAAATDASSLIRLARPVLERVAEETDGNTFLQVASRDDLIVLDQARSANPIQVDLARIDVPWHCGSIGKLHLSSLPQNELRRYLNAPLERYTPYTVTNPQILREEISEARRSGVAVNYKEHREEWCGVSAAIRDRGGRNLAYINIMLPTYRWSESALVELKIPLGDAATEIEHRINGTSVEFGAT